MPEHMETKISRNQSNKKISIEFGKEDSDNEEMKPAPKLFIGVPGG